MGVRCAPTLLAVVLIAALACEDEPSASGNPSAPGRTDPEPAPTVVEDDPLAGLDEPPQPSEVAPLPPEGEPAAPATLEAATPDRGCVALTEQAVRVWPRPGPATIVSHGEAFLVAGYAPGENGGEDAFLVRAAPDAAPHPVRTVALDAPSRAERVAPPGLASAAGGRAILALVDGRGRVRAAEVATDDLRADVELRRVAEGVDARFAPAVAATARRRFVAWTDGSGTPMRVKVAVLGLDGTVAATHDVTPPAMGASAPTFAVGATPPGLFFVDARAGISPIVQVALGAGGSPGEPRVARSVGTVTTPPRLAVARGGDALWAGFTVVGNAATTAVGFLRLDEGDAPPAAIVPGTGYGPLHVSAAPAPGAVVFAADAPKDAPPTSPREVHVRIVDGEGAGPPLVLRAPDGTARHASIARRDDGVLGVALTSGDAVHVAWVRCDDG